MKRPNQDDYGYAKKHELQRYIWAIEKHCDHLEGKTQEVDNKCPHKECLFIEEDFQRCEGCEEIK